MDASQKGASFLFSKAPDSFRLQFADSLRPYMAKNSEKNGAKFYRFYRFSALGRYFRLRLAFVLGVGVDLLLLLYMLVALFFVRVACLLSCLCIYMPKKKKARRCEKIGVLKCMRLMAKYSERRSKEKAPFCSGLCVMLLFLFRGFSFSFLQVLRR